MKLGISIYTYGTDIHAGRITVEDAIRHAASLGAQGVELIGEQHFMTYPDAQAEAARLRALVESLGMEVACYSTYINGLIRQDRRATFEELVQKAESDILMAKTLGAKIWRPAFFAAPMQSLIDLVNAVLPMLEEQGIIWGAELHAPFPPMYYKEALDAVNSPYFRLIPDFSCWAKGGLDGKYIDAGLDTLEALAPYCVHCHGKSHGFDENGEDPNTDYKNILATLKKMGFEGYVVCEYEGWLLRAGKPSFEIAETHFNLLKRYGS